ncbi:RNA polymerase I-specific transcription initiation factor RRN3 [Macrosteles quadrilineatus]|uniref:RNA polymerase I-specific transcription initiation factor RRN3 n=1 Tax=Macrosteles quadrilineatus TaxID=74068 RepID=UPI0023E2F414|nr:RNA polymerase I-specific transcription initiation factor RRN3 [Macrosteles quadrilineatus]
MSIISSRKSSLSARSSKDKSSRRSVRFQLNYNLKTVLGDETEHQSYRELVCYIRDAGLEIQDEDILQILNEARGCINILDKSHNLFVQVLLVTKWAHRSSAVAEAYKSFVVDLCSAHNYYTKFAIEQLVSNFKPVGEHLEWEKGRPCESEEVVFQRIHSVIKVLLQVIPMSVELLVSSVSASFPYTRCKDANEHVAYISNVLRILDYKAELRQQFLSLIVTKLLQLDVNSPRSDLEEKDEEETQMFSLEDSASASNPIADALDLSLGVMFEYIHIQCHPDGKTICWQRTKALYTDILAVFDKVILPTHASHHVQFLIFFLLSFKNNLLLWFLQYLWRKVIDPNVFHVIRQAAIGYIASLLSRAKYVPISAVKDTLTQLSSWIHGYISNCDAQTSCDPRIHSVFYSACQALFYLIAFRHKEIVLNSPKGLQFLQGLNLAKVVSSQLNPLRVCLPAVTNNFASVARHYQLVYCYTVIEHNRRNTIPVVYQDSTSSEHVYLDTFFPFDPYLLTRTKKYVSEWYREYDNSLPEEQLVKEGSGEGEDEDDFLMEQSPVNSLQFSYGTSPGFKM